MRKPKEVTYRKVFWPDEVAGKLAKANKGRRLLWAGPLKLKMGGRGGNILRGFPISFRNHQFEREVQ